MYVYVYITLLVTDVGPMEALPPSPRPTPLPSDGWRRVVGLLVHREYCWDWRANVYAIASSGPLFDAICCWELHEYLRTVQLLGLPRLPRM